MGKKNAAAENTQPAATAGELLDEAVAKLAPFVEAAQEKGSEIASQVHDTLGPKIDEAVEYLTPHVEKARKTIDQQVVPRLNDFAEDFAQNPTVQEVTHRAKGATKALKGELEDFIIASSPQIAQQVKAQKRRQLFWPLVGIGALAGAAIYLYRKFSSGKPEWETYSSTSWNPSVDATPSSSSFSEPVDVPKQSENQEPQTEPEAAENLPTTDEEAQDKYGPNSHIGDPDPEYPIKGNARSMKFHPPTSSGYDRTNADVWFKDEDSAEKAGFTKAQR